MRRREALRAFGAGSRLDVLVEGAHEVGETDLWSRVLDRLERDGLLARQADRPGGFEGAARQLEQRVLPALVDLCDWSRFLRYLVTAVHLRRVAEILDEPAILQALVRGGRPDLAEAAANRLADPADRVDAWTAIALAEASESPRFARWVDQISGTVSSSLGAPGELGREAAVRWCDVLRSTGRGLAVALRGRWSSWIDRLEPRSDLTDGVRLAVAEGFFIAGEPHAPELWEILSTVESSGHLRRFLPERVAGVEIADPREWWSTVCDRLVGAREDPELLWTLAVVLFGRRSRAPAEDWSWLRRRLPPTPWSAELLDAGRSWWPRLPRGILEDLCRELPRREDEAHLATRVAEARRDAGWCERALARLRRLPVTAETVALWIRIPCILPNGDGAAATRMLGLLESILFALPPEDLCRAIDRVARELPHHLKRTLDRALSAASSGPETLRVLAASSTEWAVLDELSTEAGRYAASVASSAAEGFDLRGEVLIRLARRRAIVERDLAPVREAMGRLLPAEEDRLRGEVAEALCRSDPSLAMELCEGILEDRLRLGTWLEITSAAEGPVAAIAPTSLYAAIARSEGSTDELRGLAPLLSSPERGAATVGEPSGAACRITAQVEAARHRLRHQERRVEPRFRDPASALTPLRDALGVVVSEEWLVALVPELVALGGRLGARAAQAEVEEAVFRIVGATAVPWRLREETLLAVVRRVMAPAEPMDALLPRRRAAGWLAWLSRLPGRMTRTPGADDLRHAWHRLLPVLVSWAELRGGAAPPGLRSALRSSARQGIAWRPDHGAVFRLCTASPVDRVARAERLTKGGDAGGAERAEWVRALCWLLATPAPGRLASLLATMPAGPDRDRTILDLTRDGPWPERFVRSLLPLLGPRSETAARAVVRLGVRSPERVTDEPWGAAFAALLARDALDPDDPATMPIRRRLWTLGDERLEPIARAALSALALGGPAGGTRAIRWFLNAWIRPSLGEEASPECCRRHRDASVAFVRARSLDGTVDSIAELGLDHPP